MAKPIVAFDLDEVLGEFVAPLCLFHNEAYGTSLTINDFTSYEFHKVWGGTMEEARPKVHGFFESPYFRGIPALPHALESLQALKPHFDLVVVTSRQLAIAEDTKQWVSKHYPGLFDTDIGQPVGEPAILFGNSYGMTGAKKNKSDLCRELGRCVALVDDQEKYVVDVAATLVSSGDGGDSSPAVKVVREDGSVEPGLVILFGSYAWQQWKVEDEEPPASYAAQLPPQLMHPTPSFKGSPAMDGAAAVGGAGSSCTSPAVACETRPSGLWRAKDWSQVQALLLSLAGVKH